MYFKELTLLDATTVEPAVASEEPITTNEETPVVAPSTATETTAATTPLKSKRGSVFGGFFKPSSKKEEKKEEVKEEVAPTVPAKDTEPIAAEAPQLDPVETSVPVETAATTAPTTESSTDGITPAAGLAGLTPTPASTSTTPKEKSGGFFSFLKQKEAQAEVREVHDASFANTDSSI